MRKLIVTIGGLLITLMTLQAQDTLDYSLCCQNAPLEYQVGDYYVYVPNVFTPNYDGINDVFFPYIGDSIVTIDSIAISLPQGFPLSGDLFTVSNVLVDSFEHYIWDGWNPLDSTFYSGPFDYSLVLSLSTGQSLSLSGSACAVICDSYDDEVIINLGNCSTSIQVDTTGVYDPQLSLSSDPCLK